MQLGTERQRREGRARDGVQTEAEGAGVVRVDGQGEGIPLEAGGRGELLSPLSNGAQQTEGPG